MQRVGHEKSKYIFCLASPYKEKSRFVGPETPYEPCNLV
jgi:hypothetical protein